MRQPTRRRTGFTVVELAVAQVLMALIGLVLVVLYNQSYMILNRGSVKTYQQQTAREAIKRIVPKITSAVPRPQALDDLGQLYSVPAIVEPAVGVTGNQVVLWSTAEYVSRITNQAAVTFDPRAATADAGQYDTYRLFFAIDADKDQTDPEVAPGGQIGNVLLDPNTPGNAGDDIVLARNLYDVSFERMDDGTATRNVVRVNVQVYGYVEMATGQEELQRVDYTTRVFLPYYTVDPGGGVN